MLQLKEVNNLEPYRSYGRNNGYGRNMNQRGSGYGGSCDAPGKPVSSCGCSTPGKNTSSCGCSAPGKNTSSCGCSTPGKPVSDYSCKDNNPHMRHMPVGMGYVPMQKWGTLSDPETSLCQGTAFPELNLIFCGSRGKM